jgi:hypothetical protein
MCQRAMAGLIVALIGSTAQAIPIAYELSSGTDSSTSTRAQLASVAVTLLSVDPGTATGNGDWCIGANRVVLTGHVVDLASQTEVTEGMIEWQVCENPGTLEGLPKEDCDQRHGPGRWTGAVLSDLSFDATPSLSTDPLVSVLGFRLQYRPASGSGFKRATSQSFNLDSTCSL